jgi:hypothetical protein
MYYYINRKKNKPFRKEKKTMWNKPTKNQLAKIPALYSTEDAEPKDKKIYMHFFIGGCDWYIAEFDGGDLFFGFAILNGDDQNAEWGYASLSELTDVRTKMGMEIDREINWKVQKADEIDRIKNLI